MAKPSQALLLLAQLVMGAMTGMFLPMLVSEVYGVTNMRRQSDVYKQPGMPQAIDLWGALSVKRAILPPNVRDSAFRVDSLASSLFNALFFTWITVYGYQVIKDEEWFPPSLGGSGHIVKAFQVINVPPSNELKTYLQLQLAYQVHSLLYVLLMKPLDNDNMDFMSHDLTAILLMVSSYLVNYTAISAIIGFLNDACDIFMYIFFVSTDSEWKPMIAASYMTFLFAWGYTRLYVYPSEILPSVFIEPTRNDPNVSSLYLRPVELMLSFLLVLQTWWFVLFSEKGRRKLFKPSHEGGQEKATDG
ncbi:hypothetical protein Poli38472_002770 [Pythium oligandrum]|uniref:TLC domain-containing protein n=1 Tax=Pythium oligandrum TaxID=41045 RepID=A0A8K1CIT0_PYTOL|nr:hypothetical protein Poli38472_002770 [Pythium oligandrum]|eukprot:TMW63829.1 hypothetical protein Poli38472_002770 [Pythium oligandrum]